MVCVLEEEDDRAMCIVRDHSGNSSECKVTLQVSGKMPVQEFVREIANRFNYESDSFELRLQSGRTEDVILTDSCPDTLEAHGVSMGSCSRNAFVLFGIGTLRPRLKGHGSPATTDEELSLGASASPTATSGDYPIAPPPPPPLLSTSTDYPYTAALIKQDTGYVGLVNQAMTCYLNSLLQALYMTPEFRNALYKWKFDTTHDSDKSIPFQLQKLFLNLQTSCKNAVETTELTRSFGWDSSEAWQQHDIQELCRVMFDALEQVFKDTEQFDLIDRLYQGKMIDYVKCLECGREKSREDTFLDIPLPVRPFGSSVAYSSVEEALRAFVQPETLEGNNQYHCENCAKKCDAHKGLKFSKFPYLLTLHLKRFDFDYNTMHRIKLNDKVVFPEILDLNSFIVQEKDEGSEGFPEELAVGKCDDSSTTDSGSALDDESCQGSSDAPQSIDAAQDDDEGIDVSGGNGSNHHENEKNRRHTLQKGPYMYELFSIMIHSGSASGGHYYAYIKDFSNGEWFCFNDQTVSRITNDDITKTYGGGALRGYYSGAYSSSTNAYMLMYRQIDKERNCEAFNTEQFPSHIKDLHQKLQEGEETDRKIKEKQSDMCKIKLYCNHPKNNSILETSKIYCSNDTPLKQATELAYKNFKLEGIVDLEDCRLVNYNHLQETIELSFEGRDEDPISEVFSNLRKYDFLLEIKPKEGEFQVYQPGGMVTKVYLIDMENEDADIQPSIVRGNLSQTVSSLKESIGALLNLEPTSLTIVLEKYTNDLHLIEDNAQTLKQAGFHPSNKIFVCSGPCDPDPEKPFIMSKLQKLIDRFEHLITLHFVLPDTEPETLSRLSIPSLSAAQAAANSAKHQSSESTIEKVNSSGDSGAVTGPKGLVLPLLLAGGSTSGSGDEEQGEVTANSAGGGQSDQSTSEDSSLTDSDRTLIGDVPDECPSDVDYQLASPIEESSNPKHTDLQNEVQSDSVDNNDSISSGDISDSTNSKVLYNDDEKTKHCEDNQLLATQQLCNFPDEFSAFGQYVTAELRKISDPYTLAVVKHKINEILFQASITCFQNGDYAEEIWEEEKPASQPPIGRQIYFKASPYTENSQKMLKVVVDKRTILGTLMSALEPHVGVPEEYLKIYRTYSGQQEYECSRLRETLGSYKNDERLNIKVGRALRNGEYNVKIHQLLPDNPQPFKFLFDWIISKGDTVGNTKKEIVEEMSRKFDVKIPLDRCRLRKKNWKHPVKVLLDSQKWCDDIPVYSNYDIALQELPGPEVLTSTEQLLLFAKRWHPSTMTLSPFEEILLDGLTVAELKQKLSERSGIQVENVEFAKGTGSFPCLLSVLSMSTDLEWNHNAESLDGWPLQFSEDGHVIYYRDSKEEAKTLTPEELNELTKREAARLNTPTCTVSTYLPRRERPLKIYLDQTPRRPKVAETIEPDID